MKKIILLLLTIILLQSCIGTLSATFYSTKLIDNQNTSYRFTAGPEISESATLEWQLGGIPVSTDFSFVYHFKKNGLYTMELFEKRKKKKVPVARETIVVTSAPDFHSICKCTENENNSIWADFSYSIEHGDIFVENTSINTDNSTEFYFSDGNRILNSVGGRFRFTYSGIYSITLRVTSKQTGQVDEISKWIDMRHLPEYVPPSSSSDSGQL
jgi:hypothetical protein